ncbi:MAG: ATP synthase F0 subunit B [Terriglobia bacterium]
METLLPQLADLLWGALPTAVIVLLLFLFLRWAFWRPFEAVLARRQAATEGTRRDAEDILNRAQEKLGRYEEAVRNARAEIYREQESRRQRALEERNRILGDARQQAAETLRQAKLEIVRDVEQAKQALAAETERLAEQVTRALLPPAGPQGSRGRRA